MPSREPRPASHFRLNIGGKEAVGVFKEISGLDNEHEVATHQSVDANGLPVTRKVPGTLKWGDVTLKRGVDEAADLWKWRQEVIEKGPDAARTHCTIEMLDYAGAPIVTFELLQAWPRSYKGATLDASSNAVALEEVVLVHEGCNRK